MKLKRLKGKGKRWKRGQSCLSNPENNKFREAVKGRFFQKLEGESGLTVDALAEHDANILQVSNKLTTLNVDAEDYGSIGKTFNTFATNFTTCSVPAFERFFKRFDHTSALHTKMLAIHAAAQEYINESELPETPTSFLCALIVSLEGIKDSEEDVTAALSLMAKVIRHAKHSVLLFKFSELSKLLEEILIAYQDSSQTLIIYAIGCLSHLLRNVPERHWTDEYTMTLLRRLLNYSLHSNPKIRKCCQYNISAILTASYFMMDDKNDEEDEAVGPSSTIHPVSYIVGEFIFENLQRASESLNAKTTLHLLVFSQKVILSFPKKVLQKLCEVILGVMHIGDSLVNVCGLKVFNSVVKPDHPCSSLTSEINVALLNALASNSELSGGQALRLTPNMHDEKHCSIWIATLTALHVNLMKLSENEAVKHISRFIPQLVFYFKSDFTSIHEEVFYSIECILEECIEPLEKKMAVVYENEIVTTFNAIKNGLSLQYQEAWPYVFRSLSVSFKVIGSHLPHSLIGCIKHLSNLADNTEIANKGLLDMAIGAALNGVGLIAVLEVIPLQITGNISEDETNFWILPVIQRYLKNSKLLYFYSYFYPLAEKCSVILDKFKKDGKDDSTLARSYKTVEQQIWALLPSFADGAKDAGEVIAMERVSIQGSVSKKIFGSELCNHIKNRSDIRLYILSALRNMIHASVENPGKLEKYAKNYLPALFSLYIRKPREKKSQSINDKEDEETIDPGHRLSAYSTIVVYLTITPEVTRLQLFNKALSLLNTEEDAFKKQACFNIVRAFIPYINDAQLNNIYSKINSPLMEKESCYQKCAYRILEDMLNSETCNAFIQEHLPHLKKSFFDSFKCTKANCRATRLRCIRKFLTHLSDDIEVTEKKCILQQVITEAVLCCGEENSSATRKAAFALLINLEKNIGSFLKISKEDCLELLLAGLNGSDTLIANTVLATTACLHHYKDLMTVQILNSLVKPICVLIASESREIVKSSLNFFRTLFILFPVDLTSCYVEQVVKFMVHMNEDCSKKFRLKTRDLYASLFRKFGSERILALIPEEEIILRKRLKNILKIEARKKNATKTEEQNYSSEDEEEDLKGPAGLDEILAEIDADLDVEESGNPKKEKKESGKKKGKKVWIKESEDDIVDLLDPSAAENFTHKKREEKMDSSSTAKKKDENYGFLKDSSGKFIIVEEKEEKDEDMEDEFGDMDDLKGFLDIKEGAKLGKIKKRKRTFSHNSDDDELPNKVSNEKSERKRLKKTFEYGKEFKAKKAGGDVTKKGGHAPYAYVQFSRDSLNRRKKAKYAGQFKSLVRGARKGAVRGKKLRRKR